jgi:hypothetical protein
MATIGRFDQIDPAADGEWRHTAIGWVVVERTAVAAEDLVEAEVAIRYDRL